jgi:hypothetical protein
LVELLLQSWFGGAGALPNTPLIDVSNFNRFICVINFIINLLLIDICLPNIFGTKSLFFSTSYATFFLKINQHKCFPRNKCTLQFNRKLSKRLKIARNPRPTIC